MIYLIIHWANYSSPDSMSS